MLSFHSLKQIQVLDQTPMGEGAFSHVYKVLHRETKQTFALKKIDILQLSRADCSNLKQEIKLHKPLAHTHIIGFKGYLQRKNMIYMLLEHAANRSLFFYIDMQHGLPEVLAIRFLRETALGIKYLHDNKIAHRDIKPENILLDVNFQIKICDLGWSCLIDEDQTRSSLCGTYEYMSPEIAFGENHGFSVDVWCLGILLYEMIHGSPPFQAEDLNQIRDQFKKKKKVKVSKSVDPDIEDLIHLLLDFNPNKRIQIDEIFSHPAVTKNLSEITREICKEEFDVLVQYHHDNAGGLVLDTHKREFKRDLKSKAQFDKIARENNSKRTSYGRQNIKYESRLSGNLNSINSKRDLCQKIGTKNVGNDFVPKAFSKLKKTETENGIWKQNKIPSNNFLRSNNILNQKIQTSTGYINSTNNSKDNNKIVTCGSPENKQNIKLFAMGNTQLAASKLNTSQTNYHKNNEPINVSSNNNSKYNNQSSLKQKLRGLQMRKNSGSNNNNKIIPSDASKNSNSIQRNSGLNKKQFPFRRENQTKNTIQNKKQSTEVIHFNKSKNYKKLNQSTSNSCIMGVNRSLSLSTSHNPINLKLASQKWIGGNKNKRIARNVTNPGKRTIAISKVQSQQQLTGVPSRPRVYNINKHDDSEYRGFDETNLGQRNFSETCDFTRNGSVATHYQSNRDIGQIEASNDNTSIQSSRSSSKIREQGDPNSRVNRFAGNQNLPSSADVKMQRGETSMSIERSLNMRVIKSSSSVPKGLHQFPSSSSTIQLIYKRERDNRKPNLPDLQNGISDRGVLQKDVENSSNYILNKDQQNKKEMALDQYQADEVIPEELYLSQFKNTQQNIDKKNETLNQDSHFGVPNKPQKNFNLNHINKIDISIMEAEENPNNSRNQSMQGQNRETSRSTAFPSQLSSAGTVKENCSPHMARVSNLKQNPIAKSCATLNSISETFQNNQENQNYISKTSRGEITNDTKNNIQKINFINNFKMVGEDLNIDSNENENSVKRRKGSNDTIEAKESMSSHTPSMFLDYNFENGPSDSKIKKVPNLSEIHNINSEIQFNNNNSNQNNKKEDTLKKKHNLKHKNFVEFKKNHIQNPNKINKRFLNQSHSNNNNYKSFYQKQNLTYKKGKSLFLNKKTKLVLENNVNKYIKKDLEHQDLSKNTSIPDTIVKSKVFVEAQNYNNEAKKSNYESKSNSIATKNEDFNKQSLQKYLNISTLNSNVEESVQSRNSNTIRIRNNRYKNSEILTHQRHNTLNNDSMIKFNIANSNFNQSIPANFKPVSPKHNLLPSHNTLEIRKANENKEKINVQSGDIQLQQRAKRQVNKNSPSPFTSREYANQRAPKYQDFDGNRSVQKDIGMQNRSCVVKKHYNQYDESKQRMSSSGHCSNQIDYAKFQNTFAVVPPQNNSKANQNDDSQNHILNQNVRNATQIPNGNVAYQNNNINDKNLPQSAVKPRIFISHKKTNTANFDELRKKLMQTQNTNLNVSLFSQTQRIDIASIKNEILPNENRCFSKVKNEDDLNTNLLQKPIDYAQINDKKMPPIHQYAQKQNPVPLLQTLNTSNPVIYRTESREDKYKQHAFNNSESNMSGLRFVKKGVHQPLSNSVRYERKQLNPHSTFDRLKNTMVNSTLQNMHDGVNRSYITAQRNSNKPNTENPRSNSPLFINSTFNRPVNSSTQNSTNIYSSGNRFSSNTHKSQNFVKLNSSVNKPVHHFSNSTNTYNWSDASSNGTQHNRAMQNNNNNGSYTVSNKSSIGSRSTTLNKNLSPSINYRQINTNKRQVTYQFTRDNNNHSKQMPNYFDQRSLNVQIGQQQ